MPLAICKSLKHDFIDNRIMRQPFFMKLIASLWGCLKTNIFFFYLSFKLCCFAFFLQNAMNLVSSLNEHGFRISHIKAT